MNIVGIVGSEAAKFTVETEQLARAAIRDVLKDYTTVCSGHCHLGGIDIWAEEEADKLGKGKLIYPPEELNWDKGYKPRNLLIASRSEKVFCITLSNLPPHYKGMRFETCYHCLKSEHGCKLPHVKSGGCWTALRCRQREWIII